MKVKYVDTNGEKIVVSAGVEIHSFPVIYAQWYKYKAFLAFLEKETTPQVFRVELPNINFSNFQKALKNLDLSLINTLGRANGVFVAYSSDYLAYMFMNLRDQHSITDWTKLVVCNPSVPVQTFSLSFLDNCIY